MKLKIWRDPDGLYLLKGGGPEVWKRFRIKKKFRERQGVIHGKRCGVSQNLGQAARLRIFGLNHDHQTLARSDPHSKCKLSKILAMKAGSVTCLDLDKESALKQG